MIGIDRLSKSLLPAVVTLAEDKQCPGPRAAIPLPNPHPPSGGAARGGHQRAQGGPLVWSKGPSPPPARPSGDHQRDPPSRRPAGVCAGLVARGGGTFSGRGEPSVHSRPWGGVVLPRTHIAAPSSCATFCGHPRAGGGGGSPIPPCHKGAGRFPRRCPAGPGVLRRAAERALHGVAGAQAPSPPPLDGRWAPQRMCAPEPPPPRRQSDPGDWNAPASGPPHRQRRHRSLWGGEAPLSPPLRDGVTFY